MIDTIALSIRRFDHSADPHLEPLTITKKPELTSLGDVSIQLRRAAEAVGLELKNMKLSQQNQLLECLSAEDGNLEIVAKHLMQLKNIDFRSNLFMGDEEVRIIGTRYNRGSDISLAEVRLNTSYGDFILHHKSHLLELLR